MVYLSLLKQCFEENRLVRRYELWKFDELLYIVIDNYTKKTYSFTEEQRRADILLQHPKPKVLFTILEYREEFNLKK